MRNVSSRAPFAASSASPSLGRQIQILVIGILIGHLGTSLWSGRLGQLLHVHVPSLHLPGQGGSVVLGRRDLVASDAAVIAKTATDPEQADVLPILQRCCDGEHKEVIVAVVSKGAFWDQMADVWADSLAAVNASRHTLVLALDDETVAWARGHGMNVVRRTRKYGEGYDNHGISALKFGLMKPIVALGWSVLLTDVDVVALRHPFSALHRDSDVEGMSDGWDDATAAGATEGLDDPLMGWSRYAERFCHVAMNSGLFYLRAGPKAVALLERIDARLARNEGWDQSIYNQELFTLSHDGYRSAQVGVRVMGPDVAMNSKRLFRDVRHRPKAQRPPMPALLHCNYHPDKVERMRAALAWFRGDEGALDALPDATGVEEEKKEADQGKAAAARR